MLAQISCVAEADFVDELLDRRGWADLVYSPVFAVVEISNLDGYIRHFFFIRFYFCFFGSSLFFAFEWRAGKERAKTGQLDFDLILDRYVDDSFFFFRQRSQRSC